MTRPFVLLALALALTLAGCPDEEPPSCVDTLCDAGQLRCFDNSAATCSPDGTKWLLSSCGAGLYCDVGVCKTRACPSPGAGLCDSDSTATVCSDNGDAQVKVQCSLSEICRGGECVPATCSPDGGTRCSGGTSVLTCVSGAWGVTSCPGNQVCLVGGDGEATCEPKVCEPQKARCEDGRAVVCDALGRSETTKSCASNEECVQGYCQPTICSGGGGEADAGATDAGADTAVDAGPIEPDVYIPPLEPVSKIDFKLNGLQQSFDLNPRAIYVTADQMLKISAGRGAGKSIEINIAPIDPYTVGQWNESDGTDVTVTICYSDGLNPGEIDPCPVGFSHAGIAYMVDLESNNGAFSRVKGTFTATLKDALDEQTLITEGAFDVQHK